MKTNMLFSFPPYPGPYPVGVRDLEIPVSDVMDVAKSRIPTTGEQPNSTTQLKYICPDLMGISTVIYRVFYPAAVPPGDSQQSPSSSSTTLWTGGKLSLPAFSLTTEQSQQQAHNPGSIKRNLKPRWILEPHRKYLEQYSKALVGNRVARIVVRNTLRLLLWTRIDAQENARVLNARPPSSPFSSSPPITEISSGQKSGKWPVMIFSHGLCGTRNSYSWLAGSLASHGIVVIVPDHRDGSNMYTQIPSVDGFSERKIPYEKYSLKLSPATFSIRDQQLRVRLWELALIYESLVGIDKGIFMRDLMSTESESESFVPSLSSATPSGLSSSPERLNNDPPLSQANWYELTGKLNVEEPGSVIWAGHSFGAATTVQLLKSVFWGVRQMRGLDVKSGQPPPDFKALIEPVDYLGIFQQITTESKSVLLDLWSPPLSSPHTKWISSKPMPCYHVDEESLSSSVSESINSNDSGNSGDSSQEGPIGTSPSSNSAEKLPPSILVLVSHEFVKWTNNLRYQQIALWSDPPTALLPSSPPPTALLQSSPRRSSDQAGNNTEEPGHEHNHNHDIIDKKRKQKVQNQLPLYFYAKDSIHLSQTDITLLNLSSYLFLKSSNTCTRPLNLNVWAICEWLRHGQVQGVASPEKAAVNSFSSTKKSGISSEEIQMSDILLPWTPDGNDQSEGQEDVGSVPDWVFIPQNPIPKKPESNKIYQNML